MSTDDKSSELLEKVARNLKDIEDIKSDYTDKVGKQFIRSDVKIFRNIDKYPYPITRRNVGAILYVTVPSPGIRHPWAGRTTPVLIDKIVFKNFVLETSTEIDVEKIQLTSVFGDDVVHVFGRKPRIWSYTGTLIKKIPTEEERAEVRMKSSASGQMYDFSNLFFYPAKPETTEAELREKLGRTGESDLTPDYIQEFMEFYNTFRASKLLDRSEIVDGVKLRWKLYLFYESFLIEGFLINMALDKNAMMQGVAKFSFNLLVRNFEQLTLPVLPPETQGWIDAELERIRQELGR